MSKERITKSIIEQKIRYLKTIQYLNELVEDIENEQTPIPLGKTSNKFMIDKIENIKNYLKDCEIEMKDYLETFED